MLALAGIAVVAAPGTAWADEIANSLDGSRDSTREVLSLTVPTAGGTTIYVHPVNGDGDNGCNLEGTNSVTVSVASSNTAVATVSPSSITIEACGNAVPVTVTPVSAGSANIDFSNPVGSGTSGSFTVSSANFAVNVTGAPVVTNQPPQITGNIAGLTTVNEGDSGEYGVTATDPDGDTLSYKWTVTGGNATINGSDTGSSVDLDFTDGPSTVGLKVDVSDGHGHTVSKSLSITENNVAPTVILSGAASANEGDTKSYSYTVSDPGNDSATTTESCGAATLTDTLGGFNCTFPDNGSYTVSVSADDGDPSNNIGGDSSTIAVANVAPSIVNWTVLGGTGTACLAGNMLSVSFSVTDPADEAHDPITGTAFEAFSGRTVSQSKAIGAGPWSVTATANDDDGGSATKTTSGALLYSTAGGFPLAPINTDGTSNFKLTSTIPIKLRVLDCAGNSVAGLAPQVSLVKKTSTVDGFVNEEVITVSVPDEGKTMRYDATAGQYIYNLSTKRSVFAAEPGGALSLGRYVLTVSAPAIGTTPTVGFDILK